MSRSNTPSRRYGEIIGGIFKNNNGDIDEKQQEQYHIEAALSELHSSRKNQFSGIEVDSPGDEAKRKFRERRQQTSPGRTTTSSSRSSTPERRQHFSASTIRNRFLGGSNSRNSTPERRPFRARPSDQSSEGSSLKDLIGHETTSSRAYSKSPSRNRNTEEGHNSSNKRPPFQYRELSNEESIRRFSKSPGRRREYERAANRAIRSAMSNESQNSSYARSTSKSPARTRTIEPFDNTSNESDQEQRYSASALSDKDKEIASLRRELHELQDHLTHVVASQEVLSKRAEKKHQAAESATVALEKMEKTVEIQNEQIVFYEYCLKERDSEIEKLKRELEQRRTREARLELDLEVHDLKFSIYDDYRRLLDKQKLNGRDEEDEDDDIDGVASDMEKAKLNNQDVDYVSILSKLDQLENIYERAKTDTNSQYEDALRKIALLEQKLESTEKQVNTATVAEKTNNVASDESTVGSVSSTVATFPATDSNPVPNDSNSTDTSYNSSPTLELLEKRIQILEADKLKSSLRIEGLREELEKTRAMHNDLTVFTNENELTILRLEKDALTKKISCLETEIGYTTGQIDDKTRTRRYRALEKNLNDYIAEIMSLEDKLKAKDSAISRLKERNLARRLGVDDDKGSDCTTTTGIMWNDEDSRAIAHEDVKDDTMKSRLNKKIEELRMKSKKFSQPTEGPNNESSRVAMLRKRLGEISSANDHTKPNPRDRTKQSTSNKDQSEHETTKKYDI